MAIITERTDLDNILLKETNIDLTLTNAYSNKKFLGSVTIVRPNNATAYGINDIINTDGATTLPFMDLSAYANSANATISIESISISSASDAKFDMIILNTFTIGTQTWVDNDSLNFNYNNFPRNFKFIPNTLISNCGIYLNYLSNQKHNIDLDGNSKIYFIFVTNAVFVPTAYQAIKLSVRGKFI